MCREKSKEDPHFVIPLLLPTELTELLNAGRDAIKEDPKMAEITGQRSDYGNYF
jgi:hypothetical protein